MNFNFKNNKKKLTIINYRFMQRFAFILQKKLKLLIPNQIQAFSLKVLEIRLSNLRNSINFPTFWIFLVPIIF